MVAFGVVIGTPEFLWRPSPLLEGLTFEIRHYWDGHIPHQTHDWQDNNLFYWAKYMVLLGFGLLPSLFALIFVVRTVYTRRWQDIMLGAYLAVAGLLILVTKVRFERNWETCLGPLALAAGAASWDLFCWVKQKQGTLVALSTALPVVAFWLFQSIQTVQDFRQTAQNWRLCMLKLNKGLGPTWCGGAREELPDPADLSHFYQVALIDQRDPFSADGLARWNKFLVGLGYHRTAVVESPWSKRGYPFSTVDTYNMPTRFHVFGRSPSELEAQYDLGNTLAYRRQFKTAAEHFRQALKIDPDYAGARINLGFVLIDMGQTDDAIDHLRRATQVAPKSADAHFGLGMALANAGRTQEALLHCRKALELSVAKKDELTADAIRAEIGLLQSGSHDTKESH